MALSSGWPAGLLCLLWPHPSAVRWAGRSAQETRLLKAEAPVLDSQSWGWQVGTDSKSAALACKEGAMLGSRHSPEDQGGKAQCLLATALLPRERGLFRGDNFEHGAAAPGVPKPGRADARRVAVINRLSGSSADAAKNSAL